MGLWECIFYWKPVEQEQTYIPKKTSSGFRYPSYVEDIMGPICFDYGFGPFRWVCSSGSNERSNVTDSIASEVLRKLAEEAPGEIKGQYYDNIRWI